MKITQIKVLAACVVAGTVVPLFAGDASVDQPFRNPSLLDTALWLPQTQPDARIRYAPESAVQFGDLRLPDLAAPPAGHPVIVFIHGGGWTADWSKDYSSRFVEALTRAGFATWDLEFRRLGHVGGGYPGTFRDVATGADHLRVLAGTYPLDLEQVVAVGHSSGGHLALWLAGRRNQPASSPLHAADPLPLIGVVSLAGVNDLERSLALGKRTDILEFLGVNAQPGTEPLFATTNPGRLLPFGIPQSLILGTGDAEWRIAMTREYARAARAAGDVVDLQVVEGANHFDVIDAEGPAVELVAGVVRRLLGS